MLRAWPTHCYSTKQGDTHMSLMSIWVDRAHAKVFKFAPEGLTHEAITPSNPQAHHSHTADQMEHQKEEKAFFKELAPKLTGASEILILGPGLAKHHFQTYLMEQYPLIAAKIRGCETVDHPTDHQVEALARKFFSTEKLS